MLKFHSDTLGIIKIDIFYCFRKKMAQAKNIKYLKKYIIFLARCLFKLNTFICYHYKIRNNKITKKNTEIYSIMLVIKRSKIQDAKMVYT